MQEPMIKITIAAEQAGVSFKTIYNWIGDGSLRLAHPGFVFMSEVRRAQLKKQNQISDWGRTNATRFFRDGGRFSLLSGELNGKAYKSINE